jgi:hypothetical protein
MLSDPPSRVFFGTQGLQLIEPLYAARLKTWRDTQDISALAESN